MELRQLAALVAVADHGTFSAAAAALHTVQSNVSAHVARLERELRTTLVDRGVGRLTEEGEMVVARARRIASEVEALHTDLAALNDEMRGPVRLGVIGTTGRWLAPLLLDAMAARHPAVRLTVVEGTSLSLESRLASGELDVAVMNLPAPGADMATEPLFDEDLVLVVAPSSPLASRRSVRLADLADLELLLPAPGTAFRSEIDAAAAAAGVVLRSRAELDGIRLIASLTLDGNGPAILPATAVPPDLADEWCSLPVDDLPPRRVGVAVRRRGRPSAPARAVLVLLRALAADPSSRPLGVHPPGGQGPVGGAAGASPAADHG